MTTMIINYYVWLFNSVISTKKKNLVVFDECSLLLAKHVIALSALCKVLYEKFCTIFMLQNLQSVH